MSEDYRGPQCPRCGAIMDQTPDGGFTCYSCGDIPDHECWDDANRSADGMIECLIP